MVIPALFFPGSIGGDGLWAVEFEMRVYRSHRIGDAVKLGLTAGYAIGLMLTGAAPLLTIEALFILGKVAFFQNRADFLHDFIRELLAREISLERHRELARTLDKLTGP